MFSCPTAQCIRFICEKLTHQTNISPNEVILTNAKCTTKIGQKGKNDDIRAHPTCSVLDKFKDNPTALDYIWAIVTKYIMMCHYQNELAMPKTTINLVLN